MASAPRHPIAPLVCAVTLLLSGQVGAGVAEAPNLLPEPGFEQPFSAWRAWGRAADEIRRDTEVAHSGQASALIPGGSASLYTYAPVLGGYAYRLTGFCRFSPGAGGATVRFSLCAPDRGNGSAGTRQAVLAPESYGDWQAFEYVLAPTRETVQCQVVLSAEGGPVWFDDLALIQTEFPEWADPQAGAWDGLRETRTAGPLFSELLADRPGGYHVSMWAHALYRAALPEAERETMSDEAWEAEVRRTFQQMGETHLGALLLPWGVLGGEEPQHFWRTDAFLTDLHTRYGLRFDALAESGAVVSRAVQMGAEVLNGREVEQHDARPAVSLVDPRYVDACKAELRSLGELVGARPYVRAVVGCDEPLVEVLPGPRTEAGEFMRSADEEVRRDYGFGRYGMPAPADPEWVLAREEHPFCWIAFNRWMADRYADAAMEKHDLALQLNRDWVYVPCDLWLMSGHIAFDYSRMAKYAGMLQGDPYASSAERTRGRGIYNHGLGAKLLADLGRGRRDGDPKPVEIIVQAFDYAGYEVTPEDLLEWSSQALRCGATSLCFYASDAPRFNDPPRWDMMLHIANTVSEMKAVEPPRETRTAVLYCSTAHAAEGASSPADELYTIYALLGERLGCWFDIISDRQLERGLRDLDGYKVVYLPLATYAEPRLAEALRGWVEGGGTLVCSDPDAFSWAPDGTDTSAARRRLCGVDVEGQVDQPTIVIEGERLPLFPRRAAGNQEPVARRINGPTDDSQVLATYPNGPPAVVSREVGEGKVVTFAANVLTPETLFHDRPLLRLLKGIQQGAGEPLGLPIWRFRLPAPTKGEGE